MRNVIFVIGATATGKTYFINEHFKDKDILNVYDHQQKAYDEAGYGESIPLSANFRCLYNANDALLKDIMKQLKSGQDVVVEQTLYKMKRRLAYIDANIIFYIMQPSDTRYQANIEQRKLSGTWEMYKKAMEQIEFPNPAEGINEIYEVVDGEIKLRMNPPKSNTLLEQAREELKQEAERIRKEDEEKRKRKELIESMNTRPFWHFCEVCGKKEFITAQEAFDNGWTYPPTIGDFGLLSQRTCGCGNCTSTS